MKLRKNSTKVVNPKPILKKSTSAAVNTAQLPTQQPRRRSHEQHHQLFSNVECINKQCIKCSSECVCILYYNYYVYV